MKTIAICGSNVKTLIQPPSYIQEFTLEGVNVHCGLIHSDAPSFNPQAKPDSVLLRVRAFSCNYRDKALLLMHALQSPPSHFASIGSEFVAEVVAVGSAVSDLQPGDRVIGNNSYPDSGVPGLMAGIPTNRGSKEYRVLHRAKLMRIPPMMSDTVAAAFSIGAQTTYSMIRRLQLFPGAKVLVTAARANTSLFAINALRLHPVRVFALTTSPAFAEQIQQLGVEQVLVLSGSDAESWQEMATLSKELGGFDAVIDPYFDLYLGKIVPLMATGGRYITCGFYDQYLQMLGRSFEYTGLSCREIMTLAMLNNLSIIGNCIGLIEDLEKAIQDYESGRLKVVIDSVFTENQAAAFFQRTYCSSDRFGKVVLAYT
jgi:NADPH:quinone reductase-like Zn-dependent oxidoreductase